MADTKIEMKIEEEIKPLKELCEKIVKMANAELDKGAENIETHELYEVADIIKDIAEAKKNTVEACYKTYILKAMEENEDDYGETWDENGRMNYRGQRRDSKGRYMSNRGRGGMGYTEPPYMMDMEMYGMNPEELRKMDKLKGVHYYTEGGNQGGNQGGNSNGGNSGNSGNGRMMYEEGYNNGYSEGKRNGGSNSRMERARRNYEEKHDMASLEEMMDAIKEEVEKQKPHMDANQKNMTKSKLTNLVNMI